MIFFRQLAILFFDLIDKVVPSTSQPLRFKIDKNLPSPAPTSKTLKFFAKKDFLKYFKIEYPFNKSNKYNNGLKNMDLFY